MPISDADLGLTSGITDADLGLGLSTPEAEKRRAEGAAALRQMKLKFQEERRQAYRDRIDAGRAANLEAIQQVGAADLTGSFAPAVETMAGPTGAQSLAGKDVSDADRLNALMGVPATHRRGVMEAMKHLRPVEPELAAMWDALYEGSAVAPGAPSVDGAAFEPGKASFSDVVMSRQNSKGNTGNKTLDALLTLHPVNLKETANALLGDIPGNVAEGMRLGRDDLAQAAALYAGDEATAQEIRGDASRRNEIASSSQNPLAPDWVNDRLRGVSRSATVMAPGMALGPYGAIALNAATSGADKYLEYKDENRAAPDATLAGLRTAMYETLPDVVFQKIGLGGAKDALWKVLRGGGQNAKKLAQALTAGDRKTAMEVLAEAGKGALRSGMQEVPSEMATTNLGLADDAFLGGKATSAGDVIDANVNTAVESMMLGAAPHTITAAKGMRKSRQDERQAQRDLLRDAAMAPGRTPEQAAAEAGGPGPATVDQATADSAATRADFDAFLGEVGKTPEQFRAGSEQTTDVVEQPAGEPVAVGQSGIEGQGILVQGDAPAGKPLATVFTADGSRTQAGRYLNHSQDPNAELSLTPDGRIMAVPTRDLKAGEELTVDYRQAAQIAKQQQDARTAAMAAAAKATAAASAQPAAQPAPAAKPGKGKAAKAGEWQAFGPEALGIPRAAMPQVRSADRGELIDWLKGQGIRATTENVDANTLKPSQAEFAPAKVEAAKAEAAAARAAGKPVRPVMVSSDGYVVDGHHQWLAAQAAGEQVPVIRLAAPFTQALSAIRKFPKVQKAGGAEGSVAAATSKPAAAQVAGQQPVPASSTAAQAKAGLAAAGQGIADAAVIRTYDQLAAGKPVKFNSPAAIQAGKTNDAYNIADDGTVLGVLHPKTGKWIGTPRSAQPAAQPQAQAKPVIRSLRDGGGNTMDGKTWLERVVFAASGSKLDVRMRSGRGSLPPSLDAAYAALENAKTPEDAIAAMLQIKAEAQQIGVPIQGQLASLLNNAEFTQPAPVASGQPEAKPVVSGEAPADTTQAKPAEPASAPNSVAGEATTIDVPGGQDIAARYEVRELDELIASNNYSSGQVQSEPKYPKGLQPRNYSPGSQEDLKVNSFAQGQKAGYYINTSPSAADGPPTVTANGTVLNGNGRAMSLQLASSRGDMGWYRRELDRQAATFGLDPAAYAGMRQPVLVRVVKIDPESEAAARFARSGNVAPTQAQSPARTAASLGNLVDQGVLDTIDLDDDTTFSEAVSGAAGKDFRQALASSLPPQEVPRYLNEQTGTLTDAGKELVRDLLLTKQLPVELVERMRETRKGMLRSLEQAIPQLMRLEGVAGEARVVEHLNAALDWISRHPEVTVSTQLVDSMDASGKATQQDLTGRQDGLLPEARMLAEWMLATSTKPRAVKQGLVALIRGLERRTSPILGDTRSAAEVAAEALGVPVAPGASFGQTDEQDKQVSARRRQPNNVAVQQMANMIKAQMPGAKTAVKVLADGPNGVLVVGKGGVELKVRVAMPEDMERVSRQSGRSESTDSVNGWYDRTTRTMYLVPGAAGRFTFSHEMVHHLEQIGVLTPEEVGRLYKIAKARLPDGELKAIERAYQDENGEPMDEQTRVREYAAHVIELMNEGVKLKPTSFVRRVLDWMRDLGAMLKLVEQSDAGLLREVQSGRAMTRKATDGAAGDGASFARAFPPPRGSPTDTSWTLRNGVPAMTVLRRIATIPMAIARKMGLSKPADIVLQSGRHDPGSGGGFGLYHLEEAERRKGTLRALGMTVDQFLDEAGRSLPSSTIYQQGGKDFVVVTPITDAQGRRHKVVLTLRAAGDQFGVHSIGRVEHGEKVSGEVVWSGEAIPPHGTRSANPPLKSVPQMTAGDDTRPGANTTGEDTGGTSESKDAEALMSRRRGVVDPGQQSLFGDAVQAPAPEPVAKPAAPSPAEKAVEKLANTVEKMLVQQNTLFELLAASQAKPAADTRTQEQSRDQANRGADGRGPGATGARSGDGRRTDADPAGAGEGGRGDGAAEGGSPGDAAGRARGADGNGAGDGRVGGERVGGRPGPLDERQPGERGAPTAPVVEQPAAIRPTGFRFGSVEEAMPPRGDISRARANLAAVNVYQTLARETRAATAEEQAILSQFSGWGSLKWVFKRETMNHAEKSRREIYAEAVRVMSAEDRMMAGESNDAADEATPVPEFKDTDDGQTRQRAIASTLNAHYTHPQVVADTWKMVEGMLGDRIPYGLRALEPSVGMGAFIGLEPESVRGRTAWTAIELDQLTAGMARALYSDAAVVTSGYENFDVPDNSYDLAISNFPFGSYRLYDRRYNKAGRPLIHDYFFLKSMDKVRPGGLVVGITSTGTMDKADDTVRRALYEQGDLVHAIRFPANAHDTAGTAVVTDLLIFRKRMPGEENGSDAWLKVGTVPDAKGGTPIPMNEHFIANPGQVLGTVERSGSLHGRDVTGEKRPNVVKRDTYQQELEAAMASAPRNIVPQRPASSSITATVPAPAELKAGAMVGKDGKVWQKQGAELVLINEGRNAASQAERIGWMRAIVANLRAVWKAELAGSPAYVERARLNKTYEDGFKRFGALNDRENAKLFAADPDSPNIQALEVLKSDENDEDNQVWGKGPSFEKPMLRPATVMGRAQNATEGVAQSLGMTGMVDPSVVAQAMGVSVQEAEAAMRRDKTAFEDPVAGWQARWVYLSGNVKAKLAGAREAMNRDGERWAGNVTALEAVQPRDREASEITPTLGASWVPPEVFDRFLSQKAPGVSAAMGAEGRWILSGHPSDVANATWGVKGLHRSASATDIARAAFNGSAVRMAGKDDDGKRLPDVEGERAATEKANRMRGEFLTWIRSADQSGSMDSVVKAFNDVVNVYHREQVDYSWLTFDGLNPKFATDPQRLRAVARSLAEGRLFLAHDVGTGKTVTMTAIAVESKRLGLAKKPVIATLNNVVAQFGREALEAYPGKNILIQPPEWGDVGTPTSRSAFMSRLATQDYDVAIISHETLTGISNDPRAEAEHLQQRVAELEEAQRTAKAEAGDTPEGARAVAALGKRLENMRGKMKELQTHVLKRDHITFEEMGIDQLLIDEAHQFKNLGIITAQERILGLGGDDSTRAEDLLIKSKTLHARNGGERGLFMATGTAISNSMVEVFAFQSMMQPAAMKVAKVDYFDNWSRAFGTTKQTNEVQADGTRKSVTRYSEWVNTHGLASMLREFMDVSFTHEIERVWKALPAIQEVPVKVALSEKQRAYREFTGIRMENIKENGKPEEGDDIVLVAMRDAMMSSIDMRLVDPKATAKDGGKVSALIDTVSRLYREGPRVEKRHPVQFIFQNVQSNPNAWGFSLNKAIVEGLVAAGIPGNRIAVLDANLSKTKRNKIKAEAKAGKYAVLIGSTEILGTGTNAQDFALATHHIDVPYRPADIIQRDGRMRRQGNKYKALGVTTMAHRYITEGTLDEALWAKVGLKSQFIKEMLGAVSTPSDASTMREVETEGLDPEMIAALASGDRDLIALVELEEEVGRLRREREGHYGQQSYLDRQAATYDSNAKAYRASADNIGEHAAAVSGKIPEKAQMDDGRDGKALTEQIVQMKSLAMPRYNTELGRKIGEYAGLPVVAKDLTRHSEAWGDMSMRVDYGGDILSVEVQEGSGSALLGQLRQRAKSFDERAKEAEAEAQKYERWAKANREKAAAVGVWPKEEEFTAKNAEAKRLDALVQSKPKVPSSLTGEDMADFYGGMHARTEEKKRQESEKKARADAKKARAATKAAASGVMFSRPRRLDGADISSLEAVADRIDDAFVQGVPGAQMVDSNLLISRKDETRDPKFMAGLKKHPVQTAATFMAKAINGEPGIKKRDPLKVRESVFPGRYEIEDGNASVQAVQAVRPEGVPVPVQVVGSDAGKRLPPYLADIPLISTLAIRSLVDRVYAGLSPEAIGLLTAPHDADTRVYTVDDLPAEHRPKLAQLYAGIQEADDALAKSAEAVASQFGGSVKRGPIKKPSRVIQKSLPSADDPVAYGGDVSQVLDAFRLTIVVPDIDTARKAAAAMEAIYEVPTGHNGKRRFKDRFASPLPSGYGDILMNVVVNGKVGEVQVHIPEILAVKDLGHQLFEVERVNPKTDPKHTLMVDEGRRLYGAGFDAYAGRTGTGAPVTRDTQASHVAAGALQSSGSASMGRNDAGTSSPDLVTPRGGMPGERATTRSVSISSNEVPAGSVQDQGKSLMGSPSTGNDSGREPGAMGESRTGNVDMSRRIGRPDLANPGTTGPVRGVVDQVDEARTQAGQPEVRPDAEVEAEAERRYAADPEGERRKILAKWAAGQLTDDVETRIAHHLINRDGLRAVQHQTPDEILAASKLMARYRENGSEIARAFRARRDRMATPEERVGLLAQAILTPSAKTMDKVRVLYEDGQPQEAEAVMRRHAKEAGELIEKLKIQGIDMNDLTLGQELLDPVTMAQTLRLVSTLRPVSVGDILLEYWINAILSGTQTHVVNVVSNALSIGWDVTVQRWAEVLVNSVASAEGGARAGELIPLYAAMIKSLPRACSNAVRSFRAEQDVFETEILGVPAPGSAGAGKVEDRASIKGVKGRIIRTPGRALASADSFWKTIVGQGQAAAEAYRAGRDRGLGGKPLEQFIGSELSDYASGSWHRALGYAKDLTFQAEDTTGLLAKVQGVRNWEAGAGVKPMAFILPFTRTPWNVYGTGIRKSPLGTVALGYRLVKEGYRRTFDKAGTDPYTGRDAVRHSSEQVLAWAVMFALLGLIGDDDDERSQWITGTGESVTGNRGKRELERRSQPPMSIRIGGSWYSYGRLEPAAMVLGMTVDLLKEAKAGKATSISAAKVLSNLARQTEDKTFMAGVSDLLNVMSEPDRYGARWTSRFAASWVPNIIRQPLRESQQYVPGSTLPGTPEDGPVALWLKDVRRQAFPVEAGGPRPKVDVWGREVERNPLQTSWVWRMMEGALTPARRVPDRALDLDLVVKAYNEQSPEKDWWPTTPLPYFVVNKVRHDLTEQQYHDFLVERGRLAMSFLGHVRYDPSKPVMDWQMKAIQNALEKSTTYAKARVLSNPTVQLDGEQAAK